MPPEDEIPIPDGINDSDYKNLQNYVTSRFYGHSTYERASTEERPVVRQFIVDFIALTGGIDNVARNFESRGLEGLGPRAKGALARLALSPDFTNEMTTHWLQLLGATEERILTGSKILALVNMYRTAIAAEEAENPALTGEDYIRSQLKQVGADFEPLFDHIDYQSRMREQFLGRPGKFRSDTQPESIARWQCRIGAATFMVPPTSINVSKQFHSRSLAGAAIRQANSPKTNLGHTETTITMSLLFPNHESIWGFYGDKADLDMFNWDPEPIDRVDMPGSLASLQIPGVDVADNVIDFYLSSLRGLVTQFKYSPILPIRNEYINRSWNITAVTLNNLSVSTVEGFPFVVSVNLEMKAFNFQPFLPMIQDFSQAIHWGKFRQHMGRAALALDAKVNEGFLVERPVTPPHQGDPNNPYIPTYETVRYPGVPSFNKLKDIQDGRNFDFYYPKTTPARIFAPDTTDFRQPGEDDIITEDIWDGFLSSIGLDVREKPRFNFFEYSNASERYSSERNLLTDWLSVNRVGWRSMSDGERDEFINAQLASARSRGEITDESEEYFRQRLNSEWYYYIFAQLMHNSDQIKNIQRDQEQAQDYIIKEWEVPMDKLNVDWDKCIIEGVSVSLANVFSPKRFQLQDEPSYQHIGGGDSTVSVSMLVLGEENLIKFRQMFEHINGLARLEQAHGVLGFLGIKNVLTALCGIKYVLPLNFETDTIPNYPHAYRVNMSFVDFDVMQQKREELSSEQQIAMTNTFGKRNPFLRMKQMWNVFNGYPDMPLSVKDNKGDVIGYLDPDWYFRSFITRDEDLINWQLDDKTVNLIKQWRDLKGRIEAYYPGESGPGDTLENYYIQLALVERELLGMYDTAGADGGHILPGYRIENGSVTLVSDMTDPATFKEAETRIYLGVYGEDEKNATFIDFFKGGFFMLGTENMETNSQEYILGLSAFNEDLASSNTRSLPSLPNTSKLSEYQHEYFNGATAPNRQYETMMQDFNYRNLRGRMLQAFPTYMLWLIDEGGRFAGIKLFDNIYGLNSVIDFSVHQHENSIDDTLVMTLSNMYQKLTTPYREALIPEDDPLYETPIGKWITTFEDRARNLEQGFTDEILQLNNIRLKPGVRLHLRAGYGSNPNGLQTIFNGTIAEVQQGDIMTIIAQSDAVELTSMVNSTDTNGHSGKLDGGINTGFWLSEPRDLIVRLLSMGTSYFKEWISWHTNGILFSESKFGIRHFGHILYDAMTDSERMGQNSLYGSVVAAMESETGDTLTGRTTAVMADTAEELSELDKFTSLPSLFSGSFIKIAQLMWINSFTKRDYEIFKRNIYPGNGTGLAQFMGGDMIDAGLVLAEVTSFTGLETTGTDEHGNPVTATDLRGEIQRQIDQALQEQEDAEQAETNTGHMNPMWDKYAEEMGLTDEELLEILGTVNREAIDLSQYREETGIFDRLVDNAPDSVWDINTFLPSLVHNAGKFALSDIVLPGVGMFADAANIPMLGTGVDIIQFLNETINYKKAPTLIGKLASSNAGRAMGLWSRSDDDDLEGYDEVSFRAQTYMKTVWDLFRTCAALLPNYIIAVRPFEDRSTVFYGKPHWLYTSGVIPVSSGLPRSAPFPAFAPPDEQMQQLLQEAGLAGSDNEKLAQLAEDSGALKEIMRFNASTDMDPANAGADFELNEQADEIVASWIQTVTDRNDFSPQITQGLMDATSELDFSHLTDEEVTSSLAPVVWYARDLSDDEEKELDLAEEFKTRIQQNIDDIIESRADQIVPADELVEQWLDDDSKNDDERLDQADELGLGAAIDFAKEDPVTMSFQFGWKYSFVPVWINPFSGHGVDMVGHLARQKYDERYGYFLEVESTGRNLGDAIDIWRDFRTNQFRGQQELVDIYNRYLPLAADNFEQTLDLFMRFMWQDPFNRAWVVLVVDKKGDGFGDLVGEFVPGGDNSQIWNYDMVNRAWEQFLLGETSIDDAGVPHNGTARRYMEANDRLGKSAGWFLPGVIEDAGDWMNDNIGQVLGILQDTLTGFIASIRLSLAQMGNALSQAGQMQKQANILNSVFDNSIYYQMGQPGDLIRMVDNPFTREYGEPVIEIREPFQRIHYVNSFDSILHNGITENLSGVPTVITAVSDGKYPVKVHFDKGVSPERQTESIVETGIYWDNAMGSGLFGMLQPLIHPLETARAYAKMAGGSSDQLSSRRIALSHLKNGLKNIYQGELLLIGNPDIRPFDLVYLGDVSERMYGMFEVESVTHHFTPETGFVTAVTPNAIVTVNDPARWTMISYVWSKMNDYNLREDVRKQMAVTTDRNIASVTREINEEDIYRLFGVQMNGAIQYTQGNSGLVKDISAMFTGNGVDELWNQVAKMDILVGATKAAFTATGAIAGTLVSPGVGSAVGGVSGFVVGDLLWEGWQWVKENLLDQHGCYIQFLSKDGQPMDASLSYFQGVAAGSNHTVESFPNAMGLTPSTLNVKQNGHYRITTNDLLASIGWTEVETASLYRDTSMYVNDINRQILDIANRGPQFVTDYNLAVMTARVLAPTGEVIAGEEYQGVIDGDTIDVEIIDGAGIATGIRRIRLASVNTYELAYKNNPGTAYNETLNNSPNDLAVLAYNYMVQRFSNYNETFVAIRVDRNNPIDNPEYNRIVGTVFHNAPAGTPSFQRLQVLKDIASRSPLVPWDAFMEDGRPYTLNWEMVMTGYGNVDMRDSLFNSAWRDQAIFNPGD